ncbi:hypothetical protein HGO38_09305 [Rhizobium sp. CG5]|uniref:hypothetical protein n=1 Tax=Rhizobium sp. CG5 TaxID=2726076 RepID=UPI002033CE6D|nr:hypothetical protein [Rhizobium sp. CG5]MCM2473674.1 hypothetical protein [Rhizobium sp. CG5]
MTGRRLLTLIALSLAVTGSAYAGSAAKDQPTFAYKDLPGVVPPDQLPDTSYKCTTTTAFVRSYRGSEFFADGMPVQVYQCTQGGITYQGTRPPISKEWMPGVNPRIIAE